MGKNYEQEAAQVHHLILQYKESPGNALLDIGCGTGGHITFLEQHYSVEGLDISPAMLEIARKRFPAVRFHQGVMTYFVLGRQFDVITSLFIAFCYVETVGNLSETIMNLSSHL